MTGVRIDCCWKDPKIGREKKNGVLLLRKEILKGGQSQTLKMFRSRFTPSCKTSLANS